MKSQELVDKSKQIIGSRMKMDLFSRLYGAPVFKQKKNKLSPEELIQIQDELLAAGIYSDLSRSRRKYYLKVLRNLEGRDRPRYFLHFLLFVLTIGTTTLTGAFLRGKDPFLSFDNFSYGFKYSFALLAILFAHEMGHYLYSRKYKVRASLPYFIPLFLPGFFHPGTMGAFIRIRSPIPSKKALFDIGIAGPIAGFILSVLFLVIGFAALPDKEGVTAYIEQIHPLDNPGGINLVLGHSLLYDSLAWLFNGTHLPMNEMYHFPFIFAGWFGLLVTAINLMPIGQLDGGHITYALFGDRAARVAILSFGVLIILNVYLIYNYNSYIWVLWLFLIFFFIRFRHPPTLNDSIDLRTPRKILGWVSYVIFILCFSPMPIYIG